MFCGVLDGRSIYLLSGKKGFCGVLIYVRGSEIKLLVAYWFRHDLDQFEMSREVVDWKK